MANGSMNRLDPSPAGDPPSSTRRSAPRSPCGWRSGDRSVLRPRHEIWRMPRGSFRHGHARQPLNRSGRCTQARHQRARTPPHRWVDATDRSPGRSGSTAPESPSHAARQRRRPSARPTTDVHQPRRPAAQALLASPSGVLDHQPGDSIAVPDKRPGRAPSNYSTPGTARARSTSS